MPLTPADVHNVAFSRSRIGKRGYCEQEVDLFLDLVEEELTRHIEQEAELRNRTGGLRKRESELAQRESEVAEREAELAQQQSALRQQENRVRQLRQQEAQLERREAQLTRQEAQFTRQETQVHPQPAQLHPEEAQLQTQEVQLRPQESQLAGREAQLRQQEGQLARRESQLRQREGQLARRESQVRQREGQLAHRETQIRQQETELRQLESELRQRAELEESVAACVVEATNHQMPRPKREGSRQNGSSPQTAAVRVAPHLEEVRTVAAVHGRHDMERMAVRAVTDILGNRITETVHERMRRSRIDHRGPGVPAEPTTQLEQLMRENAELAHTNGLLKTAAALLAAALEQQ